MNKLKAITFCVFLSLLLNACNGKIPGGDARKVPFVPKERVKKNLEEGRGFRLDKAFGNNSKGGDFEFASSNELWRASLDTIDFIPIATANYSGGILITDWYSDDKNSNESIKISIRFLTNEVRADGIKIAIRKSGGIFCYLLNIIHSSNPITNPFNLYSTCIISMYRSIKIIWILHNLRII